MPRTVWIVTYPHRIERCNEFYGDRCVWDLETVCLEKSGCIRCKRPGWMGEKACRSTNTPQSSGQKHENHQQCLRIPLRIPLCQMRLSESSIYQLLRQNLAGMSVQEIGWYSGYSYSTIRSAIRRLNDRGLIHAQVNPGTKVFTYKTSNGPACAMRVVA